MPERTCESKITGRMVRVRHATEGDMVFVGEKLRRYNIEAVPASHERYVVATEDDAVVGFGWLLDINGGRSVTAFSERGEDNILELTVRHLLEKGGKPVTQ